MTSNEEQPLDVAIIGAGAAGLSAARALLAEDQKIQSVHLLEANSYVGGRILSNDDFVPGNRIDLGAEFIHGWETMLTDVVESNKERWEEEVVDDAMPLLEEIFIASHADGGPGEHPTKDGKYGVYYLSKEDKLLRYDTKDEDFRRMGDALSSLVHMETCDAAQGVEGAEGEASCDATDPKSSGIDTSKSLADYLDESSAIAPRMMGLLDAGYGNTAACTDLSKISLNSHIDFEKYWEANEEEGDFRLHPRIGMMGVVEALRKEIEADGRCKIILNWKVETVDWGKDNEKVIIVSSSGKRIAVDKVIVTAPAPVITSETILQFQPPLPQWKMKALKMVGMERAIKIIVKFDQRVWPKDVQTAICDEGPHSSVPEIWFREMTESMDGEAKQIYLAVGFLTSRAANTLLENIDEMSQQETHMSVPLEQQRRINAAADIVKDQLATIFAGSTSRDKIEETCISAIMYDWGEIETIQGGYMYPKVGITRQHFLDLARPIEQSLFFAGEATNTGACCTVQAAMETGLRAANQILSNINA